MAKNKQRLRREDSFLGIHFDFHAGDDSQEIGKYTSEAMIAEVLEKVQPDYVQCDCKGHAGFSSYPTKVGNPAPGIVKDALKVWRKVTAEMGVGLYMHYSGVWDNQAVLHHPEYAVVNADGKRDPGITATTGPYVDQLLIPQLKELRDDYQVDGVWVDGDCWATKPDYSPEALRELEKATGIRRPPREKEDEGWFAFREFYREAFRQYVRHYTAELHRGGSRFQVASNWAFSSFMPEPVSADIDYISGDYTLQNSVNSARLEGRCMARQGKPWDLMAWGFSSRLFSGTPDGDERAFTTKTARQLQQEAAVVLALGGGFQAYFTQRRDGAVRLYQMDVMAEVAKFARERQAFCHKAEAIPQIAILHSGWDYYRRNQNLFAPGDLLQDLRGTLQGMLDNQFAVEVLSEHHLKGRMSDYKLLILPNTETLEAGFREELLAWTRAGGNLLLLGPKAAQLFTAELGLPRGLRLTEHADRFLSLGREMAGLSKLSLLEGEFGGLKGEVWGEVHEENDLPTPAQPAASLRRLGKGKIAGVYFNFADRYLKGESALLRKFLGGLAEKLLPRPLVRVRGSHLVDVCLNKQQGQVAVNLVNTAGPHANREVYTYDEVPVVGPLEVEVRQDARPVEVTLEPGKRPLRWTYRNGRLKVQVEKLEVHDIIWINPGEAA